MHTRLCHAPSHRHYGVHTVSAGQLPVRRGAGGTQRGAALRRIRVPKPHHQVAEGWPAAAVGLPLDAAHHRSHHLRPATGGQRQLHLRGHQQLRIQRGGWSPQRHRWVPAETCTPVKKVLAH